MTSIYRSLRTLFPTSRLPFLSSRSRFRSTQIRWLNNDSLTEIALRSLKINVNRLLDDIHYTARWGTGEAWGSGATETGMSRLALSTSDKHVRDWLVDTTKSLGCEVHVDAMGNIFAVRQGRFDGPATFMGSHLDTQPNGGRYDGVLGVMAGVEAIRVLNEEDVKTDYPVGVVNWTNEEGARFPISMVSSGVWAGSIPLERGHSLQEVNGGTATMRTELERIGYLGDTQASHEATPMAGHFELHIEQGPILEAEGKRIGVVAGVQAYRWHTITVLGKDCHSGATNFLNRSDAMLTAARMIAHSHVLATRYKALASTGVLTVKPGSTNTVPGQVKFSLDIRAARDDQLMELEDNLKKDFERIANDEPIDGAPHVETTKGKGCKVSWQLDSASTSTTFDTSCIQCIRESAICLAEAEDVSIATILSENMISGAGHDSVYTSKRCPTAMIFIPSKDGISHNPVEYSSPKECADGAQVLLGAVLRFDRLRSQRANLS